MNINRFFLLALLISAIFAQVLIVSSDSSSTIESDGDDSSPSPSSSAPRQKIKSSISYVSRPPPKSSYRNNNVKIVDSNGAGPYGGGSYGADTYGGQGNYENQWTGGNQWNGGNQQGDYDGSGNEDDGNDYSGGSGSSSTGTVYAQLSEKPNRKNFQKSYGSSIKSSYAGYSANNYDDGYGQDDDYIQNAQWISPPSNWYHKKVVIKSPCFYNSCPYGLYTFRIQATCNFKVYLISKNGGTTLIGSGGPWKGYAFTFKAGCGEHQIKIVLDCYCTCGKACYTLYQDQTDCFYCNNPLHFYNPNTCECECISNCNCYPPQKLNTDNCTCECKRIKCPTGQYWNGKKCACECNPKCCGWKPIPTPCGC